MKTGFEKKMERRRQNKILMDQLSARSGAKKTPAKRRAAERYGKSRQEIYCHNCDVYVQFTLDLDLDGKHEFRCPN
jgi:hypothetical protein